MDLNQFLMKIGIFLKNLENMNLINNNTNRVIDKLKRDIEILGD